MSTPENENRQEFRKIGKNRQVKKGGEEGNTEPLRQPSRKTFYCFTLFNFTTEIKIELNRQLNLICKKYKYGEEICPSTGREHLQGFMHLKKPMRITEIKLIGKPHLEACLGTEEQNINYVSKDGIVTSYGYPKPLKLIENLFPWQEKIKRIALSEPDDRTVYWFWSERGSIGKSQIVKYIAYHHKAILCQGGKHSDIMNLIFKTDMDESQVVFFDIPRAHKGKISYSALECIKNGMVSNTKYETGFKLFNSPHVIVFANFPPDDPKQLSCDRWVIEQIDADEGGVALKP